MILNTDEKLTNSLGSMMLGLMDKLGYLEAEAVLRKKSTKIGVDT